MNKKFMTVLASAAALTGVFTLAACGNDKPLTDAPLSGFTLADFTQGEADAFFASDGWCNGDVFNVTWNAKNTTYSNGAAHLAITDASATAEVPYLGGELRSYQTFGYGDFSVSMKPAKVAGTASTFFTYTGPSELDENGLPNPHDEIDIEFLGKDTTKVQFNYFVNGNGGNEYMYDLGFDASLEFHEYGFRWTKDYIVWFVDSKPVYKVEASESNPLPSTAGRILMNHWCGTEDAEGWMGEYKGSDGATCDYKTIKTSATPIGEIPEPSEIPDASDVPETGWTDIDYSAFGGWCGYDIDKTDGITISHDTAKKDWLCEGMDLSDSYSWIKFNINNNDTKEASVRIDVKDKNGAGGVAGIICDSDTVRLDSVESAVMMTIAGGESYDVVLKIKDMYVDQFVVFLNSMSSENGAETGSITITGLKGIINEDVEAPKPAEPSEPEIPEGDNCVLTFTSTAEYTVDKSGVEAAEITVTYEDVAGGTYKNIQAQASELAADNDTFSLKITNNGDESVSLRIDLIGENTVTVGGNTAMNVCNLSATATGGSALYTDTEWGGTMITLDAGEEVTVVITYSNDNDMGAVQRVQLYLDTSSYGDEDTHSGNVTFGEFKFSCSTVED